MAILSLINDRPALWRSVLACFGLASLTAACSSTPSTWAVPVKVEPASFTIHEVRVFHGECLFPPAEREAAVLATLGGLSLQSAAGAAVTALGTVLEEAGNEKTFTYSVDRALQLTRTNDPEAVDVPACIQLVQGSFAPQRARCPPGRCPAYARRLKTPPRGYGTIWGFSWRGRQT